ncbi:MAG: MJ0042-type zinc finger domain-containing protein, partial [Steroidobacteraceae bacterium]
MFTVCPKCALTLVVTAADLRVAQGYVRCGRCSSVFNALARLSDDRQAGPAADESAALSSPEPTETTESTDPSEPSEQADADLSPLDQALTQEDAERDTDTSAAAEEPIPEDALEFNPETTDVGAVFVEPPPNPQWTAATGSFKAMRAATEASTREVAEVPAEPAGAAGEPQVDVEIDAAFLADMLRDSAPQSEPQSEAEPTQVQQAAPTAPDPAAEREPPDPPTPARPASTASARAAQRHGGTHIRPPAEASVRRHGTAAHEHAPRTHQAPTVPSPAETTWTAPQGAADESGTDEIAAEDTSARSVLARLDARVWAAGAALALLVLIVQIVNHNRDALAATSGLRRPLTALYHSLGVQLVPQ